MADRYWVGGGSSTNWSATGNTNWAATSGGAGNQSVPGTGDNVFFDANSGAPFAAVISASQSIGTLDMTGSTGTLTHNASVTLTVDGTGVFTLASGVTYTMAANTATARTIAFTGGAMALTSAGKLIPSITVNGASSVVTQQDALTMVSTFLGTLTLTSGQYVANNFAFTGSLVSISGSTTRALTMGSGTWTLKGTTSTIWDATTTTNLTFNKDTANIVVDGTATGTRIFFPGALTYNNITITGNGGHSFQFGGGIATFANVSFAGPGALNFAANMTISNAPSWVGTRAAPIVVMSSTSATARTLTFSAGTADCDYLIIQAIALAAGTHYAGFHSVNMLGGTGWTYSANPAFSLSGVTRDAAGNILVSATVYPVKLTSSVIEQAAAAITSDGTTGAYTFSTRDNTAAYGAIGHKADTPHKFGNTDLENTPA